MDQSLRSQCIAEFMGTGLFIFFGASCLCAVKLAGASFGLWEICIVWGLGIALAVYLTAAVSGAHLNPAVTIALWLFACFDGKKVIPYIISQTAGAFGGALVCFVIYYNLFGTYETAHQMVRGSPESLYLASIFSTFPNADISVWQAALVEVIITSILMCLIMALTDDGNGVPRGPLAPLLIDFNAAREAWPECPLPAAPEYPGGRSRVEAHLAAARASHTRRFGQPPGGLWPAEGALSTPFLKQIGGAGFAWTASSHGVLKHSAGNDARTSVAWLPPEGTPGDMTLFFRNEYLSDLIGFEYAKWHGRDAAQHFMTELKALHLQDSRNLIPVFLDGENAWEYYPYNAWYFFSDLYESLARNPAIRTLTLSEAATSQHDRRVRLPRLTAGSWVYGTLSTWIGNADKNRAWEMLCDIKQCADRALDSGRLDAAAQAEVIRRLSICESSDWFWWLGDYNSPQSVACFDGLFRENLKALYRLLDLPIPASVDHPISKGGGAPESGGTMRRAN